VKMRRVQNDHIDDIYSTNGPIIFLRVFNTSYRHFTSCLTSYSHCIATHHYHHHIIPHHHDQPSPPSLPPHYLRSSVMKHTYHPTSSCTHLVLNIHICSMLKEADDPFEMFIPTGIVKRSESHLEPTTTIQQTQHQRLLDKASITTNTQHSNYPCTPWPPQTLSRPL
jgi:hypothetical protein